jgi:hypothetical protein
LKRNPRKKRKPGGKASKKKEAPPAEPEKEVMARTGVERPEWSGYRIKGMVAGSSKFKIIPADTGKGKKLYVVHEFMFRKLLGIFKRTEHEKAAELVKQAARQAATEHGKPQEARQPWKRLRHYNNVVKIIERMAARAEERAKVKAKQHKDMKNWEKYYKYTPPTVVKEGDRYSIYLPVKKNPSGDEIVEFFGVVGGKVFEIFRQVGNKATLLFRQVVPSIRGNPTKTFSDSDAAIEWAEANALEYDDPEYNADSGEWELHYTDKMPTKLSKRNPQVGLTNIPDLLKWWSQGLSLGLIRFDGKVLEGPDAKRFLNWWSNGLTLGIVNLNPPQINKGENILDHIVRIPTAGLISTGKAGVLNPNVHFTPKQLRALQRGLNWIFDGSTADDFYQEYGQGELDRLAAAATLVDKARKKKSAKLSKRNPNKNRWIWPQPGKKIAHLPPKQETGFDRWINHKIIGKKYFASLTNSGLRRVFNWALKYGMPVKDEKAFRAEVRRRFGKNNSFYKEVMTNRLNPSKKRWAQRYGYDEQAFASTKAEIKRLLRLAKKNPGKFLKHWAYVPAAKKRRSRMPLSDLPKHFEKMMRRNPKIPTKEIFQRVYPSAFASAKKRWRSLPAKVRAKYGSPRRLAHAIVGAVWYKKMGKPARRRYEQIRKIREPMERAMGRKMAYPNPLHSREAGKVLRTPKNMPVVWMALDKMNREFILHATGIKKRAAKYAGMAWKQLPLKLKNKIIRASGRRAKAFSRNPRVRCGCRANHKHHKHSRCPNRAARVIHDKYGRICWKCEGLLHEKDEDRYLKAHFYGKAGKRRGKCNCKQEGCRIHPKSSCKNKAVLIMYSAITGEKIKLCRACRKELGVWVVKSPKLRAYRNPHSDATPGMFTPYLKKKWPELPKNIKDSIAQLLKGKARKNPNKRGTLRCPLHPQRRFKTSRDLLEHMDMKHSRRKNIIPLLIPMAAGAVAQAGAEVGKQMAKQATQPQEKKNPKGGSRTKTGVWMGTCEKCGYRGFWKKVRSIGTKGDRVPYSEDKCPSCGLLEGHGR